MPKVLLLTVLLGAASLAHAQSFDSRFEEGYALLARETPIAHWNRSADY